MTIRNGAVAMLDHEASTGREPYAIITADCSDPREIDDGVFVERLPAEHETYRVGVCVVDTSSLYNDRDILKQALTNTQAEYWTLPNGERGYKPMIEPAAIRDLEFKQGKVRSALILSFIVGEQLAPTDVDISFGKVEVTKNLNYKDFGRGCRYSDRLARFGRASALIIKHLQYNTGGDYDEGLTADEVHRRLIHVPPGEVWTRGSRLNEAFMVSVCHLTAKALANEGWPTIYRVHDPENDEFLEILPPDIARFSLQPGPHVGLSLNPYTRITSPLRRLEDFMMSHQLDLRGKGELPTAKDCREMAAAVQRLNQHLASEVLRGPLRLGRKDTLGMGRAVADRDLWMGQVIPLRQGDQEAA